MLAAILEVVKHYAIEIAVVIVLAVLTICWNLLARGMTTIFVSIKIYGNWTTEIDRGSGFMRHETAKLHQLIHKVWGNTRTSTGERYRFNGTIVGDRLCITYRARHGGTDCGAAVLTINAEARAMQGNELGFDKSTGSLYSYPYVWSKV